MIWDGNLDFLPEDLRPQAYSELIESDYKSGSGVAKKNLYLLSQWVTETVELVKDELNGVFDGL